MQEVSRRDRLGLLAPHRKSDVLPLQNGYDGESSVMLRASRLDRRSFDHDGICPCAAIGFLLQRFPGGFNIVQCSACKQVFDQM